MEPKVSISIDVTDMEEVSFFYSEALGCKKVRDSDAITVLSASNTNINLLQKETGSNPLSTNSLFSAQFKTAANNRGFGATLTPYNYIVRERYTTLLRYTEHGPSCKRCSSRIKDRRND